MVCVGSVNPIITVPIVALGGHGPGASRTRRQGQALSTYGPRVPPAPMLDQIKPPRDGAERISGWEGAGTTLVFHACTAVRLDPGVLLTRIAPKLPSQQGR